MKVLFVGSDPTLIEEGGSRARMREYAAEIGELHILTTAPRDTSFVEGSLHIYGVRTHKLMRISVLSKHARSLILKEDIEIVSAQDPFEHGLAALRAIEGTPAKLHVQIHTDFLSPWFVRSGNIRSPIVPAPALNHMRRNIADQVLPRAHGIRVVSLRVRTSLIERYGTRIPDPVVLPIHIPTDTMPAVSFPAHPFTFALITVSRLEPEKRIEDIIEALAQIRDTYPSVGLFIVGEGSERKRLERMVGEKKLTGRVIFLGWRTDALGLMKSAQAYIQASAYEGYGRTLIEAALAGVPIITTDVGIVGEVFRGYEDVLAAPVADPTALALHIRGLVEDMRARTELSMHAETAVRKHLTETDSSPVAIARDLARLV